MAHRKSSAKKASVTDDMVKKFTENFASVVEDVPIEQFIERDNLEYMVYTIENRAIPSIIDGVKPGQRLLLYSMFNDKVYPGTKSRKSSRLVGSATGQFHPHGDAAMYETLVGLAVPYRRVPLIDGDGSFGKAPGDEFAQSRYTEAKLSDTGYALVSELKDDAVEFIPTYDGEGVRPLYLSPQFPVLLMNGAEGLSEGFSTNTPSHNPREIMELCLALLDNPDMSDEDVFRIVPGPDWATGASVVGSKSQIEKYQTTGRGLMTVRGTYHVDKRKKVVWLTELPPGVSSKTLLAELREAARSGKIEGIKDVQNMSDKDNPFRIAVHAKRGVDIDELVDDILIKTKFETSFAAQCIALDEDKVPRLWSLRDAVLEFLRFRDGVLVSRSKSRLVKVEKRHVQATALEKVFLDKETAVDIVMKSKNESDAVAELEKHFDLTNEQAAYVANLPIKRLSRGSVLDATKEVKKLEKEIKTLNGIIRGKKRRANLIRKELTETSKMFDGGHYDRKTIIDNGGSPTKRTRKDKDPTQTFHYWKLDTVNGILSDVGDDIGEGDVGWSVFSNGRVKTFDGKGLPTRVSPKTIAPDVSNMVNCGTFSPDDGKDLVVVSTDGKALRMALDTFNPQGISGHGVSGMKLDKDCFVAGAVTAGDDDVILTKSIDGRKVTRVDDIPVKGRNTLGVSIHKAPARDTGVFEVMVAPKSRGFVINGEQARVSARATGINRGSADSVSVPDEKDGSDSPEGDGDNISLL